MALFPTPAEIAAQTSASRDRAIDVIRIVSLVAVVFGHTIMAISTVRHGVFVWGNLLESLPALGALTWLLQIMPLFFFAGTAASVESWSAGRSWGGWLMARCTRLYRPVFFYLAFWGVALAVLRYVLPKHVYEPVAGTSIQLLWFLSAYVLVLAAIPLLYQITSTARLAAAVVAVYGLIVVIDILRLGIGELSALGYLNMVVWLIPGMFGVAYRRGLLGRRAAIAVAAVAFVINMLLVCLGPYELSLVGYQGQRLPNMTPPSALLAGHAIMMCALAIAVAPAISRWAQRPRVWWLVAIGNSGAMTLYLWHMPALLGMHLVFDALGVPRYDMHAPGFIALSVVQVVSMTALSTGERRLIDCACATGPLTSSACSWSFSYSQGPILSLPEKSARALMRKASGLCSDYLVKFRAAPAPSWISRKAGRALWPRCDRLRNETLSLDPT